MASFEDLTREALLSYEKNIRDLISQEISLFNLAFLMDAHPELVRKQGPLFQDIYLRITHLLENLLYKIWVEQAEGTEDEYPPSVAGIVQEYVQTLLNTYQEELLERSRKMERYRS